MSSTITGRWRGILAAAGLALVAVFAVGEVQANQRAIDSGADIPCPLTREWQGMCDEECDARCKAAFSNDWIGQCEIWMGDLECCHCVFQAR